jgi:hypothetical protein
MDVPDARYLHIASGLGIGGRLQRVLSLIVASVYLESIIVI